MATRKLSAAAVLINFNEARRFAKLIMRRFASAPEIGPARSRRGG
jgi:hypothetical protein